jgi:hypothetical protein
MRKALGAAGAVAAVLLVFACSASSSHPPVENCQGNCTGGGGGGGGSGSGSSGVGGDSGGDAPMGPCGVAPNSSQCVLYMGRQCCTQLKGCTGSIACQNLFECVNACGAGTTCQNMCDQAFPTGQGAYQLLVQCAQTAGSPCTESGTGDPCGSFGYPCALDLTCNGTWCTLTRECVADSDCTGIGPGGGNELGLANACIRLAGGATECAPGCRTPQDCSIFPGTTCIHAFDATGSDAFVCGSITDAATE